MSESVEYRCFIGGLSWSTSDRALKNAFEKFGNLTEAKVIICVSLLALLVVISIVCLIDASFYG